MANAITSLDLHGKNTYQARIAIDYALKKADTSVYRIRLIHGHHGGTAIKDMIFDEYSKNPKVLSLVSINPSTTDLVIREL